MTTASADVALKGLVPLLEAVAKVRTEREAELVVVGKPRDGSSIPSVIDRLGLEGHVTFASGVAPERMVELYNEAEVAVVPSLYEGFSLPAIEAMSCAAPLVTTTGGALPEVTGPSGEAALTVPPNDPGALATAILTMSVGRSNAVERPSAPAARRSWNRRCRQPRGVRRRSWPPAPSSTTSPRRPAARSPRTATAPRRLRLR